MMTVGTKLSEKRKQLGITQIELAEKMHVTRQTVSRWESGAVYPDIEKIPELAEILGVSCDYLLKDNAEQTESVLLQKPAEPSRLLKNLVGKTVIFSFYDGDCDMDIAFQPCVVESFDGSWFKVCCQSKKQEKQKLISVSCVMSVMIKEEVQ